MIITGITQKCNFNCLFCLDRQHKHKKDLSFGEIRQLFQKVKSYKEDTVMLMTGESFIRPDFLKILEEAKKCNLKLKVTTNGSMLSYYDFLVKVIKGGVVQINFSFHSHIPKVANAISRNKFCHSLQEKALLNIESFNKDNKKIRERLAINFNTVINSLNYKELEGMATHLKKILRHTPFRVKFKFMDLGGNDSTFYKKILPPLNKIQPYLLKALKALGGDNPTDKISACGFPLCILSSYEWSSVELKENLYHNNLYLDSRGINNLRTQNDIAKEDFYKYRECRGCSLCEICPGVRRDYLKVYPNFNLTLSDKNPKEILHTLERISIFDSEIKNKHKHKCNY
ncbi:MAG: radical SAM protein [Candidatus Omnitrophota bacterium]|nr:radical SAM protein [Candidatus Omnitrophota bacterium]